MISDNIKRLRENMGLSQAALARKLGVTRASVNAWEMELSSPTAAYLVEMARLFHTTTDDILGLSQEEQISLRGMNDQEKRLVYDLVEYINSQRTHKERAHCCVLSSIIHFIINHAAGFSSFSTLLVGICTALLAAFLLSTYFL